jgi:hypothetical protein
VEALLVQAIAKRADESIEMAATPRTAHEGGKVHDLTREIAVQAELLALNFALEGEGAEEASAALIALSRELRQAGRFSPSADARTAWRLGD